LRYSQRNVFVLNHAKINTNKKNGEKNKKIIVMVNTKTKKELFFLSIPQGEEKYMRFFCILDSNKKPYKMQEF